MARVKPANTKRTKGKGLLSVEIPIPLLEKFRQKVRSHGGRMCFEIARMIEADLSNTTGGANGRG